MKRQIASVFVLVVSDGRGDFVARFLFANDLDRQIQTRFVSDSVGRVGIFACARPDGNAEQIVFADENVLSLFVLHAKSDATDMARVIIAIILISFFILFCSDCKYYADEWADITIRCDRRTTCSNCRKSRRDFVDNSLFNRKAHCNPADNSENILQNVIIDSSKRSASVAVFALMSVRRAE